MLTHRYLGFGPTWNFLRKLLHLPFQHKHASLLESVSMSQGFSFVLLFVFSLGMDFTIRCVPYPRKELLALCYATSPARHEEHLILAIRHIIPLIFGGLLHHQGHLLWQVSIDLGEIQAPVVTGGPRSPVEKTRCFWGDLPKADGKNRLVSEYTCEPKKVVFPSVFEASGIRFEATWDPC